MRTAVDPAERAKHMIASRRDAADQVLQLAEHLAERDRLLLEQLYRHGQPIAQVARLTRQRPRVLQRRVKHLLKRVASPQYRWVAGRLELLPPELRAVARRGVLQGQSLRETARTTGRTLHEVRVAMVELRAMARTT